MWKIYINGAKEVLGESVVVIDRYPVAKKYRDEADKLRKQELQRLKSELSAEEYENIKGSLWPFRKNKVDLPPRKPSYLTVYSILPPP